MFQLLLAEYNLPDLFDLSIQLGGSGPGANGMMMMPSMPPQSGSMNPTQVLMQSISACANAAAAAASAASAAANATALLMQMSQGGGGEYTSFRSSWHTAQRVVTSGLSLLFPVSELTGLLMFVFLYVQASVSNFIP